MIKKNKKQIKVDICSKCKRLRASTQMCRISRFAGKGICACDGWYTKPIKPKPPTKDEIIARLRDAVKDLRELIERQAADYKSIQTQLEGL